VGTKEMGQKKGDETRSKRTMGPIHSRLQKVDVSHLGSRHFSLVIDKSISLDHSRVTTEIKKKQQPEGSENDKDDRKSGDNNLKFWKRVARETTSDATRAALSPS
jgi:hypothetical protein